MTYYIIYTIVGTIVRVFTIILSMINVFENLNNYKQVETRRRLRCRTKTDR